jgi:MFS family permease
MVDLFFNLGALIGPILGGTLYTYLGYRKTMDIWMICFFICALVYGYFNCGIDIFKK